MPRNPALDPSYYHGDSPVRAVSAPQEPPQEPQTEPETQDTTEAPKPTRRRKRAG